MFTINNQPLTTNKKFKEELNIKRIKRNFI